MNQVAIHSSDELDRNFLGAHGFALAVVGATAKVFIGHGSHHIGGALIALRLPLGKRIEMHDFRSGKKHRCGVGTGGHASAAPDAGRCVHGAVGLVLGHEDGVRVGRHASRRA